MHEIGLMESALELVLEQARMHRAERVGRIVLRVGALSGVEPAALRFAHDVVTRGTLAAGAELELVVVPARACCPGCAAEFAAPAGAGFIFECPSCRALCGEVVAGRELELARIEFA